MPIQHPLFMVREGALVRPDGPRSWAPLGGDPVKSISASARDDVLPYVLDVDGVEARAPQFQFYQRLEQSHATPWIHSGCRTPEDAMDTFFAGAEALTIEHRHMSEAILEELASIAEGEIHLAVDLDARMPRPAELVRLADDHRLAGIVLLSAAGLDEGRAEHVVGELQAARVGTSLLLTHPTRLPALLEQRLDHVIQFPRGAP